MSVSTNKTSNLARPVSVSINFNTLTCTVIHNHHGVCLRGYNIVYRNKLGYKTTTNEPVHDISNNVVCATSKASDQPAHTFASPLSVLWLLSY